MNGPKLKQVVPTLDYQVKEDQDIDLLLPFNLNRMVVDNNKDLSMSQPLQFDRKSEIAVSARVPKS